MADKHWLIKSEPESYSIDHLKKDGQTWWSGVRNYQAKNFLKEMRVGDHVLFYHSNCAMPGISGIAEVSQEARPDETQFDKKSPYYESRATKEKPVWECSKIKFTQKLKTPVTLGQLRIDPDLSEMHILRKGSRLSVTPVSTREFERILELGS